MHVRQVDLLLTASNNGILVVIELRTFQNCRALGRPSRPSRNRRRRVCCGRCATASRGTGATPSENPEGVFSTVSRKWRVNLLWLWVMARTYFVGLSVFSEKSPYETREAPRSLSSVNFTICFPNLQGASIDSAAQFYCSSSSDFLV